MDGWMKNLMSRGTIKWMAYIKCIWSATDGWDTLGMDYVDRMHLELQWIVGIQWEWIGYIECIWGAQWVVVVTSDGRGTTNAFGVQWIVGVGARLGWMGYIH